MVVAECEDVYPAQRGVYSPDAFAWRKRRFMVARDRTSLIDDALEAG